MRFLLLALLAPTMLLAGCAASKGKVDGNYLAYLDAVKQQPKIVEIVAQPGQTIELKGVQSFIVYGMNNAAGQIQPFQPPPSAGHLLMKEFFSAARVAIPYGFYGFAADRLFSFGKAAVGNAGNNTTITDAYNDKHTISGSHNGDMRDIGEYHDDHSDRSVTDRHDATNSYNQDSHDDNSPAAGAEAQ